MPGVTFPFLYLGSVDKMIVRLVYPDNDNERRFVALVTANRLKLQKCDAKSKDFQLFILSSE